ncbi:acetylglutamate kinase [Chloroflexota bacterium]
MDKIIVVKLGGAILGSRDTSIEDITKLQQQGRLLVIVHGGGKVITEWLIKKGISSRFAQGERITDRTTLEVVVSVLAGLVNKKIVTDINSLGGRAVGISGVDGGLIQSRAKSKDLGYVGSVVKVNLALLETLLKSGYIPVVAPISLHLFEKPVEAPGMLNINADIVAGEIAANIGAERLVFLTDVIGICNQQGKLLPRLSLDEAESLIASGIISGGMIPKIKACKRALANTSTTCIIDGRQPYALLSEVEGGSSGTTIQKVN